MKATTYYTSLTLANEWNVPNSGSACPYWKFGDYDHKLTKCKVTNNQDHIDANKNKWEEDNAKKSGAGGNYEKGGFGIGNRLNRHSNNGGTNSAASGAAYSGVSCKNGQWIVHFKKINGNLRIYPIK